MPDEKDQSPNSIKYSIWETRTKGSPSALKKSIDRNKKHKSRLGENPD